MYETSILRLLYLQLDTNFGDLAKVSFAGSFGGVQMQGGLLQRPRDAWRLLGMARDAWGVWKSEGAYLHAWVRVWEAWGHCESLWNVLIFPTETRLPVDRRLQILWHLGASNNVGLETHACE
jgi:hypothetical protein